MDIVVKGRKTEVTERFRKHVVEKLSRIERFDGKATNIDVELSRERNPRQAERCDRIEITLRTRGPVVRAEACAGDPYAALDIATAKLEARLRRAADRRRVHHGRRSPVSVAVATSTLADLEAAELALQLADAEPVEPPVAVHHAGPIEVQGEGPMVVREKTHTGPPMDLCQALYEMELVGHDFYLFVDADSKLPSVVYRRRGYDYGVIHLEESGAAHYSGGQPGTAHAA
ncbi:MAG: ribosome hibernation-promoting factor, HPF/YfiA family [Actinocrinis sp.]